MERSSEGLLEADLAKTFRSALGLAARGRGMLGFGLRLMWTQAKAARRRRMVESRIHVPPVLIASVTRSCNLACPGCYEKARQAASPRELSSDRLEGLLSEARELGTRIFLLAGGEPLARKGLCEVFEKLPDCTFLLFTNGLLMKADTIDKIKAAGNVLPVISIEGGKTSTDLRRGQGISDRIAELRVTLKSRSQPYGHSITVTRENLDEVTQEAFLRDLSSAGCRLIFFVEYVPIQKGTENLVLSRQQRTLLSERLEALRNRIPALMFAFPGDEERYGGCLAAGRGFVHVNASGALEACPFAPVSDRELSTTSFENALASPALAFLRENHSLLSENGGCALWANKSGLSDLLAEAATAAKG